jgi:hypothetical protein
MAHPFPTVRQADHARQGGGVKCGESEREPRTHTRTSRWLSDSPVHRRHHARTRRHSDDAKG